MSKDGLNIVLVGMMGAGKTYIGKKLAKLVSHFAYVDIDEEIERQENLNISEIFEKYSEQYFRESEKEMIKTVSRNKNQIISTGGGSFENEENINNLKSTGVIFYLKSSPNELFKRLSKENEEIETRPLLNKNFSIENIKKLLKKREKNYAKAHFIIDTEGKRAYTILDDILREYENYVK